MSRYNQVPGGCINLALSTRPQRRRFSSEYNTDTSSSVGAAARSHTERGGGAGEVGDSVTIHVLFTRSQHRHPGCCIRASPPVSPPPSLPQVPPSLQPFLRGASYSVLQRQSPPHTQQPPLVGPKSMPRNAVFPSCTHPDNVVLPSWYAGSSLFLWCTGCLFVWRLLNACWKCSV